MALIRQVILCFGHLTDGNSFFNGRKGTKPFQFKVDPNTGSPFVAPLVNTRMATTGTGRRIKDILCSGYISEIVDSIIRFVSVDMINIHSRPASIHIEPSKPMNKIGALINFCCVVAIVPSGNNVSFFSSTFVHNPSKCTTIWAIVHKFFQSSLCDKIICSHVDTPISGWLGGRGLHSSSAAYYNVSCGGAPSHN